VKCAAVAAAYRRAVEKRTMSVRLTQKLEQYVRLGEDDRTALAGLARTNVRKFSPRREVIREGENPHYVNLVLDGWAIRHKMLADGRRQIIAFLIPGDLCDLNVFILRHMDHSIGALTPLTIAQLPREIFEELYDKYPRITQAFLWDTLVGAAIQREWTLNLGQRTAFERVAHLLCELYVRLRVVGLCNNNICDLPLTQNDVAEATGMTPVHVNRTIQELRAQGLIVWKGREFRVPDMDALRTAAMFNSDYLHLGHEGAYLDAND
jgi:CRP-like cAMP-binding protein